MIKAPKNAIQNVLEIESDEEEQNNNVGQKVLKFIKRCSVRSRLSQMHNYKAFIT